MTALSPKQARVLLEAAHGDRTEALYALAITAGLRQGELLALRWRNVDLDAARLEVVATLQSTRDGFHFCEPKTARSRRRITLSWTAIEALRRRRVALPRIRFHDMRHSSATLLLRQGVHPKIVSEMLRHSTIAITLDLYSHITPTMQQHAAAALDVVLQG